MQDGWREASLDVQVGDPPANAVSTQLLVVVPG